MPRLSGRFWITSSSTVAIRRAMPRDGSPELRRETCEHSRKTGGTDADHREAVTVQSQDRSHDSRVGAEPLLPQRVRDDYYGCSSRRPIFFRKESINDMYRIFIPGVMYESGSQKLQGGNIQIR
jgi:hypothetical protein